MEENRIGKIIKRIEIKSLFSTLDLNWELSRETNILSGGNGSGKSTVLGALAQFFKTGKIEGQYGKRFDKMVITFEDGTSVSSEDKIDPQNYNVDAICTFDPRLKEPMSMERISEGKVKTDLDWEIYRLQIKYMNYQLDQGKRAIELLLQNNTNGVFASIMENKERFFNIIDSLFSGTCKTIDRNHNELRFYCHGNVIEPYDLSSGEKQMLILLTTVLTENLKPYVLIMDEPEISLHYRWQKDLIEIIRELNPNVQIIMSTHSPAVIMSGWMDKVIEISDIVSAHE